jgi:hypothetical protein
MIQYDKKFLKIEVDKANSLLIQHWFGFSTSEQFHEGILKALEIFRKEKLTKMISDTKNAAVVSKEETDFAASIVPDFIKAGLSKLVFVVPTNVFAQLSVENFKKGTDSILKLQYCENLESAKAWLSEK